MSIVNKEVRRLRPGEILLRVDVCGVCGTDVHIVEGASRSNPPVVLGHECAGTVENVAEDVTDFRKGQKVAVDPNIACGSCFFCSKGEVHLCSNLRALGVDIDGGMAEYCIVPQHQAYVLPDSFPKQAAAFIEPVSCVIHGIDRAGVETGDTVVIIGSGTIGLLMLQLVKDAGAGRTIVVEPRKQKRNIAQKLGADVLIDPSERDVSRAIQESSGEGADVVFECAGRGETAQLAVELARRGGTVEFFGVCPIGTSISLEPNKVYFKELTIVGSYVNPHTFPRAISALQSGTVRIDEFQINEFSLEEAQEALRRQSEGKTIKSMIIPSS